VSAAKPASIGPRRVVVVSGLSGAGKASILHTLEDLGYDAVDNPPLGLVEDLGSRADRAIAIGVDARTRGFDADLVLAMLTNMRRNPALLVELVFVWADEATLVRRYTETRRRHPLAPGGRMTEGIEIEQDITASLRESANLLIDTSDLPLARLRQLIERHFGQRDSGDTRMAVSLVSFAYAKGLPKEADLVFDARFLRNPHYDPMLRARTGLDPAVGEYIGADPDHGAFVSQVFGLVDLVLPRFVQEGKKYATIAIGCTGGRHRSVYLIERLASHLTSRLAAAHAAGDAGPERGLDWRQTVTHRELRADETAHTGPDERRELSNGLLPGANDKAPDTGGSGVQDGGDGQKTEPIQAQEA
jgi:UPF0042 nucleotide-binding protein